MEFESLVGLEVHAELNTKTKAFCSCKASFGDAPNTNCCPVCVGFPGALPVLNKKVVEYAVKMGLATNCRINSVSKSARKNYFYPDLAKGYQITQSDNPICEGGYINIGEKKIRINRIHIEEDAGKLIHENGKTLIDFNRAGVPLIEIVTEPDIASSQEAYEFLEKIRRMLLDLDISDCKMQEGSLRCDVNVSIRKRGDNEKGERCEIKNINSFSAVIKCIEYETMRQIAICKAGGKIERETRRWDSIKNESVLMRTKENLADYRYIQEPDIPPIVVCEDEINEIKLSLPELFDDRVQRYSREYRLSTYDAGQVAKDKNFTKLFEAAVMCGADAKTVANFIMCDIAAYLSKENLSAEKIPFSGEKLAKLCCFVEHGEITHTAARAVLEEMFLSGKEPEEIVKEKSFTVINDENMISDIIEEVLKENEKSVSDYKRGKTNAFGYLMGQCVKKSKNRANPKSTAKKLKERLEDYD